MESEPLIEEGTCVMAIVGLPPASLLFLLVIVAAAIGLCTWRAIRTYRPDDLQRAGRILTLFRRSALIAVLLGVATFLTSIIDMLARIASMPSFAGDVAYALRAALVPLLVTVACAVLLLIVTAVLEYVYGRRPRPAELTPDI